MKTKYIVTALLLMVAGFSFGQTLPHGISYQGVARNESGEVISNKTLTFKINLQNHPATGQPVIYFSEIQRIVTSEAGRFNLVIGKGSTLSGSFYQIPWSTVNIWMETQVKQDGETEFSILSTSEMLAVPYAFHAGTADALEGNYSPYSFTGSTTSGGNSINVTTANSWLVSGSTGTTPATQYIGTSDLKDLVIKTNSIERFRIYSTGNITMNNSLNIANDLTIGRDATIYRNIAVKNDATIDSNLTIKRNVQLNTSSGATINNGPFIVGNSSPSVLTGTLRVDHITNLNNGLNVNNIRPTLLTGTLRVNNATDLYNSFTVNLQSPSVMTGTLRVDSDVTFKNRLIITNPSYNSFTTTDGALVIAGGLGIQKNLQVGGDAKVNGKTTLNGQVKITDPRISIRPDSGALVITGGLGVGKELTVGGFTHLYDSLRINGKTRINNALIVDDSVIVGEAPYNQLGLRVTGRTTLNGQTFLNGKVSIYAPASLSAADQNSYGNYPLQVQGGKHGISIKIDGTKDLGKNFISFWDRTGMQGRIEGFAAGEFTSTSLAIGERNDLVARIARFAILDAAATIKVVAATATLVGASSSSTGCVGLGVCATTPIPSLIAAGVANLALGLTGVGLASTNLARAVGDLQDFDDNAANKSGVTYESGAGDYAEYLEKLNPSETMFPGDIVGLKAGKISRNTEGADKIMVISVRPIVLGNMPKTNSGAFEKVAFLGQVPVTVTGKVNAGDYILPDGNNAGMGKAIAPSLIGANDLKNIIGVAWESSDKAASTINIAIGLHVNDNNRIVETLSAEVSAMQTKMDDRNKKLASLLPGYKNAIGNTTYALLNENVKLNSGKMITVSSDKYVYFDVTKEQIEEGINLAEKQLKEIGKNLSDVPGFQNYKTDAAYRTNLISKIQEEVQQNMSRNKQIDAASVNQNK